MSITDEQLRNDLQFLLDCEFENMRTDMIYQKEGEYVTEVLELLIISSHHTDRDYQYLLARYTTPQGEHGFGEVCYMHTSGMTMLVLPSIDEVIKGLTEQGRERVVFVAAGLKDGSLVDASAR